MKECEKWLKQGKFGFDELSKCIECKEVCQTMKRKLGGKLERRIGMVSGK